MDMNIRLSVVMIISIVNQSRCIEDKMSFITSWKNVKTS